MLLLLGITLGPFLLVVPASVWLYWTLTPLQKILPWDLHSKLYRATQPRNVTNIRWVLKTAPRRKSIPMLPQDAVAGASRELPVSLSDLAFADGWRGVALSSPEKGILQDLRAARGEMDLAGHGLLYLEPNASFSEPVPSPS